MKTGIELIAIERQEQIEKHGYSIEKDAKNNDDGQLIYAVCALTEWGGEGNFGSFHKSWPDSICEKLIEKPLKDRLIIAGAFIAAELDRMQYIESKNI